MTWRCDCGVIYMSRREGHGCHACRLARRQQYMREFDRARRSKPERQAFLARRKANASEARAAKAAVIEAQLDRLAAARRAQRWGRV